MLGNIEDLRDFHRRVMLPRMEEAVGDASLMRSRHCHQDCEIEIKSMLTFFEK